MQCLIVTAHARFVQQELFLLFFHEEIPIQEQLLYVSLYV